MKALLIDDSAIMRMMLKSILKQVDITDIVEAGNGLEGIQALTAGQFQVVFLDLHMPQMDGASFLKEVRAKPEYASLPIVVVSSDTESGQVEELKRLGATTYITKPFRVENLRQALESILPKR